MSLLLALALACTPQPAADAPPAPPPEVPPAAAPAPEPPPSPGAPTFEGPHATAMADAAKAAEAWLALEDAGDHAAAWDISASAFQEQVPKEAWAKQAQAVRGPFGALQGRTLLKGEYATSLPGAPDGEYVVLQYQAHFEKKAEAVETITPALDWDGAWKVSGYYVK